MGLANNLDYEATSHFKERLHERFNIAPGQWKSFMKQVYGSLKKDPYLTSKQGKNYQVYVSEVRKMVVVVDPKNKKLITVYHDTNALEDNLIELHANKEENIAKEVVEEQIASSDINMFAEELRQRELQLRKENQYLYAQKMIKLQSTIFDRFVNDYHTISTTEPNETTIKALNRLKSDFNIIKNTFDNMKLPYVEVLTKN